MRLPRLELRDGIPPESKTLCIISVLLTDENSGSKYASLLEQYMLANRSSGQNLLFGILADLKDSEAETSDSDSAIPRRQSRQ
jgi:cyclic beta-1,2-glucan synthetase